MCISASSECSPAAWVLLAGPSGLFVADFICARSPSHQLFMIKALPFPRGLVRTVIIRVATPLPGLWP